MFFEGVIVRLEHAFLFLCLNLYCVYQTFPNVIVRLMVPLYPVFR